MTRENKIGRISVNERAFYSSTDKIQLDAGIMRSHSHELIQALESELT